MPSKGLGASALAEPHLENAPDSRARAGLLAPAIKESRSGAWLNVLPISFLGLCMDDNMINLKVAVGPCLGAPLCRPHTCHHCGTEVDSLATHGLSYCWSEGHHHSRVALNDTVHRVLLSAKVPSHLELYHLAFITLMGNTLMASLWPHVSVESCWCGT